MINVLFILFNMLFSFRVCSVFFVSVPFEQLKKTRVPFFSFSLSPFPYFANLRKSKHLHRFKEPPPRILFSKILCNL